MPISRRDAISDPRLPACEKASAADHRHAQQHQQHAPRPESIERSAQGQLHGREAEEVGAGQQAQICRLPSRARAEHRRQGGRDGAQQRRKKVGKGKRPARRPPPAAHSRAWLVRWHRCRHGAQAQAAEERLHGLGFESCRPARSPGRRACPWQTRRPARSPHARPACGRELDSLAVRVGRGTSTFRPKVRGCDAAQVLLAAARQLGQRLAHQRPGRPCRQRPAPRSMPPAVQACSTSRTCCLPRLTRRAWLSGLQGNSIVTPLPSGRTSRQSSAGAQAANSPAAAIHAPQFRFIDSTIIEPRRRREQLPSALRQAPAPPRACGLDAIRAWPKLATERREVASADIDPRSAGASSVRGKHTRHDLRSACYESDGPAHRPRRIPPQRRICAESSAPTDAFRELVGQIGREVAAPMASALERVNAFATTGPHRPVRACARCATKSSARDASA